MSRFLIVVPMTCCEVLLLVSYLSAPSNLRAMQPSVDRISESLLPGKPLEADLAGEASRMFNVAVSTGQFFHLDVDQMGIDVQVNLFGPDGNLRSSMDTPSGEWGPERLSWIADATGTFKLEVHSPNKSARLGHFKITLSDLRASTSRDKDRVVADRLLADASGLTAQNTPASIQLANHKYESASLSYERSGDLLGKAFALLWLGNGLFGAGDATGSSSAFVRALQIFDSEHYTFGQANASNNLAVVYGQTGDWPQAEAYAEAALPLWQKIFEPDNVNIANAFNTLAETYRLEGKYAQAGELYSRAEGILEKNPDREKDLATVWNNIALVLEAQGSFEKAEVLAKKVAQHN
jgi:tetratricopeptide (TPR) repeat protein